MSAPHLEDQRVPGRRVCALDAALRLIAEGDTDSDGLLTRSELAAYDGSVPASCDVGRDWSASAKARGGDWDEQAKRKTGLARLCYQVLCDRDRSIALGQAYRSGYRKARSEADCARRSVAVVLSGGFTSPASGEAIKVPNPSPTSGPCSLSSRARS